MTRSVVYGSSVLLDAGGNKWTNLADGVSSSDAATVGQLGGGGAVDSVFGRTGTVLAVTGDYYGAVAAALTGATQASRYAGATASGAPASGTFVKGDWVVAQDGKIFVCTSGGTPGTWVDVSSGASVGYATPAVALGSSAAAGAASTVIRSDSTIAAFDATSPSTQAIGDSAVVGTAAFAARRDHKHAMPAFATPAVVLGSAAAAGSAATLVRSDSTIAAFDTTAPSTQAFGDAAAVGTAAFAARRDHKHAMPASPAAPIGSTALVYRYTVAGSDKASIDTGVDTPDAGSNDWTNGDLLEIWFYLRTDETATVSVCNLTFNNDGTALYDRVQIQDLNTTLSGTNSLAQTAYSLLGTGASNAAGFFASTRVAIPNYMGTVGNKAGDSTGGLDESSAALVRSITNQVGYRSTTAISRLAITPATALKKLKVGSQVLIYKRLAS